MKVIAEQIQNVVKELFGVDMPIELSRPEPQFGDYASNVALQLAKPLGKNPRQIAEGIAVSLREVSEIAEVSIAGPGFINLKCKDEVLLAQARTDVSTVEQPQRYVVEYSCPNAFKELHTGHLYQTIAGDVLARLVERAGHTVYRTSFGSDVGLNVARALWGMIQKLGGEHPEKLDAIESDAFARAYWISQCYVVGAKAHEQDPQAIAEIATINKMIYAVQDTNDHDTPLAQMYWTTRQWSYDYFDAFYKLLDVDVMRQYPESMTAPIGMQVVTEQLEKGNLVESQGAIVYEGDESRHLHTRVFVTSAGLPTYETKDIGVIWLEKADYDFQRRVLITGNDQKEYMRVVFAAAETFDPSFTGMMTHLTTGTVKFADGSKMSSRLGNVTRGIDVIDAVRVKVRGIVTDEKLVEDVTLGAVKYALLRYRLGGDIAFDIDETVSLQGNSGPYLQYAHARAQSIIAKAEGRSGDGGAFDVSERALVRKLSEYNEIVQRATDELAPHHICNYLYELAQEFNRFYETSRIIGDEREAIRLPLVQIYRDTLARGLTVLGIAAPETM